MRNSRASLLEYAARTLDPAQIAAAADLAGVVLLVAVELTGGRPGRGPRPRRPLGAILLSARARAEASTEGIGLERSVARPVRLTVSSGPQRI